MNINKVTPFKAHGKVALVVAREDQGCILYEILRRVQSEFQASREAWRLQNCVDDGMNIRRTM